MNEIKEILKESARSLRAYLKAQFIMLGVVFVLYAIGLLIIGVSAPLQKRWALPRWILSRWWEVA